MVPGLVVYGGWGLGGASGLMFPGLDLEASGLILPGLVSLRVLLTGLSFGVREFLFEIQGVGCAAECFRFCCVSVADFRSEISC